VSVKLHISVEPIQSCTLVLTSVVQEFVSERPTFLAVHDIGSLCRLAIRRARRRFFGVGAAFTFFKPLVAFMSTCRVNPVWNRLPATLTLPRQSKGFLAPTVASRNGMLCLLFGFLSRHTAALTNHGRRRVLVRIGRRHANFRINDVPARTVRNDFVRHFLANLPESAAREKVDRMLDGVRVHLRRHGNRSVHVDTDVAEPIGERRRIGSAADNERRTAGRSSD
jgi:hypothetical protein